MFVLMSSPQVIGQTLFGIVMRGIMEVLETKHLLHAALNGYELNYVFDSMHTSAKLVLDTQALAFFSRATRVAFGSRVHAHGLPTL